MKPSNAHVQHALSTLDLATGLVTAIENDGRIIVQVDGGFEYGALVLAPIGAPAPVMPSVGQCVLVAVPESARADAVILGALEKRSRLKPDSSHLATVDESGQNLRIEAANKIELKCGRSSMTMSKDGNVVVRGVTITTRASKRNKVKGATVNIN